MTNNIEVPSLASSALLVHYSCGIPSFKVQDKQASRELAQSKGADAEAIKVNKNMLEGNKTLARLRQLNGFARNHITYRYSVPWDRGGWCLLTTPNYITAHKMYTETIAEFESLRDEFLESEYSFARVHAEAVLGDLYDETKFPSTESLLDKFYMRVEYKQLPETGDCRLDIPNEARSILEDSFAKQQDEKLNGAMNHIWQQLHTALSTMAMRLNDTKQGEKNTFRNSLVTNVLDVVDLLSTCNVTGDSQMEAMRLKLDGALRGITPEGLRDDEFLRAETKDKVDDILKSLPSLDM